MKLSKKQESELYQIISDEIMNARIKIWKMKDDKNISIAAIDDILFKLGLHAPLRAINIFKKEKK